MTQIQRGDGIGIEYAHGVVRGVRLHHDVPGTAAAAEVPLHDAADDRAVLDAFVRLRAELGGPPCPARLALFPNGSAMHRTDVTGLSGPELNTLRAEIERRLGASSSVLVDSGPRRYLHVLHWDPTGLRRLEDLAERAGFLDVAIDPGPLALARVFGTDTTFAVRSASTGEAYVVAFDAGLPVAAASIEAAGLGHPALESGSATYSVAIFDELVQPAEIAEQLTVVMQSPRRDDGAGLVIDDEPYLDFPPHDLRSPERQCIALGAAVGAAGLAGRLRPVDIVVTVRAGADDYSRPWAIERISTVPRPPDPVAPGFLRRLAARLRPRRTRPG